MRILYFFDSMQFDTGSPKALVGLIDALDRSRRTPLFLAGSEGPLVTELARREVEIIRASAGSISHRRPLQALGRICKAATLLARHRVDVLHVNEFGWNLDLVLGAALLRLPVVLHVHNPLTVDRRNLDRLAASRVVFVSRAHLESTRGLELIRDKAMVLYNPVDVERFAAGTAIRSQLGLGPEAIVVVSVCQITPNKAVDELLEVARVLIPRWKNLHFVIAGPPGRGYEQYAAGILAAAAAPPFRDRVHFLGPRQDVPDLFASADIFFLPTRGETFGIVIAEAMAASLPVVSTEVGGIPEIVRSAEEGLLLKPDDRSGFTAALEGLIADPARRVALGRRGRAGLTGRLDRKAFTQALDALYEGL